MKYSPKIYAKSLLSALDESAENEYAVIFDNFIKVLAQEGDVLLFPVIEKEVEKLHSKKGKPDTAKCRVAQHLDLDSEITRHLKEKLGDKVNLEFEVDKDLIGGLVVKYSDTLIDASVKKQLQVLKKVLTS